MIHDVLLEITSAETARRLNLPLGTKVRPDALDAKGYYVKLGYVEEYVTLNEVKVHRTSGILKG